MKRLYIGGLSHTISQKDIKDRFGKFGDVQDVELLTRKDDEGVPYKTFGYINIEISDADYRRCVTVLNKSKWKGGTLQIELAKESFLHRLAQERHEAAETVEVPAAGHRESVVESLKAAGVENFHMKAAVPGTEVPGHKDWVVSKFGRVLPVLNLKCQGRNKFIKYDPSKHSHNIKKLENASEVPSLTPVSNLTWELSTGDDEISRKRRGEFPPQKPRPTKIRKDSSNKPTANSQPDVEARRGSEKSDGSLDKKSTGVQKSNGESRLSAKLQQKPAAPREPRVPVCVLGGGGDSDEEIRMLVARKRPQSVPAEDDNEDDNLEVVGGDYMPSVGFAEKDEREYDSADTDEILTSRKATIAAEQEKPVPDSQQSSSLAQVKDSGIDSTKGKKAKKKVLSKTKPRPSESVSDDEEESGDSNSVEKEKKKVLPKKKALPDKKAVPNKKALSKTKPPQSESNSDEDESEENADSDTLEEENNTKVLPKKKGVPNKKALSKTKPPQSESDSDEDEPEENADSDSLEEENDVKVLPKTKAVPNKKALSKTKPPQSESDSDGDESEESVDSDYEAMFTNCQRLEFSLADLEQLVKDSNVPEEEGEDDDDEQGSCSQPGPSQVIEALPLPRAKASQPPPPPPPKTGTTPEEIIAAILEGDSSEEEETAKKKKKRKTTPSLTAFQGTKGLTGTVQSPEQNGGAKRKHEDGSKTEEKKSKKQKPDRTLAPSNSASESNAKKAKIVTSTQNSLDPQKQKDALTEDSTTSPSSTDDEETSELPPVLKQKPTVKTGAKTVISAPDADSTSSSGDSSSEESDSSEGGGATETAAPNQALEKATVVTEAQKKEDNQRRLAAQEKRQKEAEQQKKLIQGALSKVDTAASSKGKHIVFDSDNESDEPEAQSSSELAVTPKKVLFQDSQSAEEESDEEEPSASGGAALKDKAASKLFDSSEDDDDDDDDDDNDEAEDGKMFQIKPQFEGKSGQKLMALQSRFGTDERFQMGSRFMESDDETEVPENKPSQADVVCELEDEKKKNLDILSGLLNINIQPSDSSKAPVKSKTFREALHYDPTREEHAAFETKNEEPKKESKVARRKKREEAEKLPEVSKEIYYDVSGDLKAVFGTTKETVDEEKKMDKENKMEWDKEKEEEEEGEEKEEEEPSQDTDEASALLSSFHSTNADAEKEESTGFKFSFFGEKAEADATPQEEEYKIETLKGAKVSWQVDPRFQDSSSEDEEEAEQQLKDQPSTSEPTAEPVPSKKVFFFFYPDDERLKEGPKSFYRSTRLEDHRGQWEEQRTALIEEYRKKHKDAKRKLKVSQRN